MKTSQLTLKELKELKNVKRELLTDKNVTFTSYARCNEKLQKIAMKYNVDTQVIYNLIP